MQQHCSCKWTGETNRTEEIPNIFVNKWFQSVSKHRFRTESNILMFNEFKRIKSAETVRLKNVEERRKQQSECWNQCQKLQSATPSNRKHALMTLTGLMVGSDWYGWFLVFLFSQRCPQRWPLTWQKWCCLKVFQKILTLSLFSWQFKRLFTF